MNSIIFKNSIRFFVLIFLQVIVFNHINLFGYINPMPYVIWVILFPIRKEKGFFMFLSFLLGLFIDFFSDSGGIHASSLLVVAFIRLPLLQLILGKSDFDYILFNIRQIAFSKALFFILTITLIHHFVVFSLAYFNFNDVMTILYKTFATSLITLILVTSGIILFTKKIK